MALRIGRLDALHAEPCYVAMVRPGMTLVDVNASALADAMAQGRLDAGPVPVVACAGLEDTCEPVAGFCIASVQPTGGCLLHAARPITTLTGATIAVPEEATTSRQLLRLLLHHYQVQPAAYVPLSAPMRRSYAPAMQPYASVSAGRSCRIPTIWGPSGTIGQACRWCGHAGWCARMWRLRTGRAWKRRCTLAWKMVSSRCVNWPRRARSYACCRAIL